MAFVLLDRKSETSRAIPGTALENSDTGSVIRALPHCAIFFGLEMLLPGNSTLIFF